MSKDNYTQKFLEHQSLWTVDWKLVRKKTSSCLTSSGAAVVVAERYCKCTVLSEWENLLFFVTSRFIISGLLCTSLLVVVVVWLVNSWTGSVVTPHRCGDLAMASASVAIFGLPSIPELFPLVLCLKSARYWRSILNHSPRFDLVNSFTSLRKLT